MSDCQPRFYCRFHSAISLEFPPKPHCHSAMKKMTFFTNLFFILLGPLCGIVTPSKRPGKIFSTVRVLGPLGDGKNLDSPAIDKAIDACVQAGGGTVLVPAGNYFCGSLSFSNKKPVSSLL